MGINEEAAAAASPLVALSRGPFPGEASRGRTGSNKPTSDKAVAQLGGAGLASAFTAPKLKQESPKDDQLQAPASMLKSQQQECAHLLR